MASVETHTQFTGSHNEPEAQGSSGWEHLWEYFRLHTGRHRNTNILYSITSSHMWSVVALLMMECSGRLERHSHEVWLTKAAMTTDRSILGGDSSISWQTYRLTLQEWICVCAQQNSLLIINEYFCCVYLRNVEKLGKVEPVVWITGNIGQWCISYVQLQLKGVPLAATFNRVCCTHNYFIAQLFFKHTAAQLTVLLTSA